MADSTANLNWAPEASQSETIPWGDEVKTETVWPNEPAKAEMAAAEPEFRDAQILSVTESAPNAALTQPPADTIDPTSLWMSTQADDLVASACFPAMADLSSSAPFDSSLVSSPAIEQPQAANWTAEQSQAMQSFNASAWLSNQSSATVDSQSMDTTPLPSEPQPQNSPWLDSQSTDSIDPAIYPSINPSINSLPIDTQPLTSEPELNQAQINLWLANKSAPSIDTPTQAPAPVGDPLTISLAMADPNETSQHPALSFSSPALDVHSP